MIWKTTDYKGNSQVWYSEDVILRIRELAEKTLNYVDYKSYFKRNTVSFKFEAFNALNEILKIINEVDNESN